MSPRTRDDDYAMIRAGQHPSDMKINYDSGVLSRMAQALIKSLLAYGEPELTRAIQSAPQTRKLVIAGHLTTGSPELVDMVRRNGRTLTQLQITMDEQLQKAWVRNDISLNPLPDDGYSGHRLEPETKHTIRMTDYSTTPVARPTLVYGEDVANMNEGRTMAVIKALNAEVKDLSETGVTSRLIEQRIAERGAAINELVAHLDSFATATA